MIYGYAYEVCLETHALKVESTDYPLIVSPSSAETLMERAVEAVKIVSVLLSLEACSNTPTEGYAARKHRATPPPERMKCTCI